MKKFKVDGLWTVGEDVSRRVPGTIVYSKKGLRLDLLGTFRKNLGFDANNSYPVIKGIVGQNPYGSHVTLFDGFTQNTKINNSGFGSEAIRFAWGTFGDAHLPPAGMDFESIDLTFSHLHEWVGWSNIDSEWSREGKVGFSAGYVQPEPHSFRLGEKTVEIASTFTSSYTTDGASLKEKTHLYIKPVGQVEAMQANELIALPLQNLLTFATDHLNGIDDALLRGGNIKYGDVETTKKYYLVYDPIYEHKEKSKRLSEDEMLFGFGDVQNAGLNIFQSWFDFIRRQEEFTTVYFSHLYRPPKYLDDRLLSIIKAFTLYCASSHGVTAETAAMLSEIRATLAGRREPGERELLEPLIPTGSELEMPFHLLGALRENSAVMSQIVKGDFREFVLAICRTLSFIERRTHLEGVPVMDGPSLYYAIEKLRWLVKFVVLKELGFRDENLLAISQRNSAFHHLKAVASRPI